MAEDERSPSEAPKLIVDDDWKSQAQAEKQKLADQEKKAQEEKAAAPGEAGPLDFRELIKIHATQAAMYMGAIPDPQTQQRMFAPELARLYIDMLVIIQDKTKGNLSDEEQQELDGTVADLRAIFVETVTAMKKAYDEGKIQGGQGAGGMGDMGDAMGGMAGGFDPTGQPKA